MKKKRFTEEQIVAVLREAAATPNTKRTQRLRGVWE